MFFVSEIFFVFFFTPTDKKVDDFVMKTEDSGNICLSTTCNLGLWDFEEVGKLLVLLCVGNIGGFIPFQTGYS